MAAEVKVSLQPDEFETLRECVRVTLELIKFYQRDLTAQRLTDVEMQKVLLLEDYLATGKRRK